jgi:23S rRNA (adenine2503-C2)-methyltransferase
MDKKVNLIEEFYKLYIIGDKDFSKLEDFRKQEKLQPYRIKQIFHEIFKNSRIKFDSMTTLSKELRKKLDKNFDILTLKPIKVLDSNETTKIAFETNQGDIIESVIMYHYHEVNWEKKLNRITLCVSSQVWCAVWCIFCVTWKLWFKYNLSFTDIISQLLFANNFVKQKFWKKEDWTYWKVRNVVFMWMWEPLLNYENVKKSIYIMLNQNWFSLSKRHITISTSWIIPWIEKILKDRLPVMLAVSLHAPNQALREKLIPIAKKYTLDNLMTVLDKYNQETKNRIFYEYIMIKELTDKPDLAVQLANLIKHQDAHVNLIPYNENPAIDLEESSWSDIVRFKNILENEGITVTIRDTLWRQLKGACWQLGYEKLVERLK